MPGSLLVAVLLATAPQLDPTFDPTTLIGISLEPSWPRPWGLSWTPDKDWRSPWNAALMKFQSAELQQCLGVFIDADDVTASYLARLAENPTPEKTSAARSAAWLVWTSFGVDEAIREIATTGQPGESAGHVLDACRTVCHSLMTRNLPHVFIGAARAPALPDLDQLVSRDQPVTLKLENAAASQVVDALAKSAGLAVQTVGFGDTCHMSVDFEMTPLRAALEQIVAQTRLRFELVDPRTLRVLFPAPLKQMKKNEVSPYDKSFTLPVILTHAEPNYPQDALMAAAPGKVILHFVVRDDGTVGEIHAEQKDEMFSSFIDAALEAARRWTYRPAMKDGQPISIEYSARFEFNTSGPPPSPPPRAIRASETQPKPD